MPFEVYNSKEIIEEKLRNHRSEPLGYTDVTGKCVVVRRKIGCLWRGNEDPDYRLVFVGNSMRECREWMEDDVLYLTSKYPDLIKYGKPRWNGNELSSTVWMGWWDFALDYQASVPRTAEYDRQNEQRTHGPRGFGPRHLGLDDDWID